MPEHVVLISLSVFSLLLLAWVLWPQKTSKPSTPAREQRYDAVVQSQYRRKASIWSPALTTFDDICSPKDTGGDCGGGDGGGDGGD